MPEQNYHSHIEQAIQNVLSKVKTPARGSARPAEPQPVIRPAVTRPAPRREVTGSLSDQAEADPAAEVQTPETPITAQPEAMPESASGDEAPPESTETGEAAQALTPEPVYLEAEDLYTPLQTQDLNPEIDEPPIQEDTYVAPYNLFEEFVETELNILLSRYLDLCRCSQCRADIVALALHQLPAYYVTGTRGTLTAKSVIWTRYMQQVMDAVTKAIHIVYKRPRPNCGKIRQMLWVKPELEEVKASYAPEPEQQFFGAIYQDDVDIKFSDEVQELIQVLELAPTPDKTELLPVFSPVVQNAYKQYTVEEEPAKAPPDDLRLLDID